MPFLETVPYRLDEYLYIEFIRPENVSPFCIASEHPISDAEREKLIYGFCVLQAQFGCSEFLIQIVDEIDADFIETEKGVYFISPERYFQIESDEAFVMSKAIFWDCYVQDHLESPRKTIVDRLKTTFREKGVLCAVVCTKDK